MECVELSGIAVLAEMEYNMYTFVYGSVMHSLKKMYSALVFRMNDSYLRILRIFFMEKNILCLLVFLK